MNAFIASWSYACWNVDPDPFNVADANFTVGPGDAVVPVVPDVAFFDDPHPAATSTTTAATATSAVLTLLPAPRTLLTLETAVYAHSPSR